MNVLEVRELRKTYPAFTLKGVSLDVPQGAIVGFIDRNGAGKSTTLMTICGGTPPRSGEVLFRGHPIHTLRPNKIVALGISQVPEGRLIFPDLTVQENLDLGAFLRSDKENIRRDMDYIFSLFPILAQRRRQAGGTLSGGEQQRVSIARALAKNPKILLCDEPTGALDYKTGKQVLALLQQTCRKQGRTVIDNTHNSALAAMADRVIRIGSGKVVEEKLNEHPTPVEEIEW